MNKLKSVFVGALAALLLSSGCAMRTEAAEEPVAATKIVSNDGYYFESSQHDAYQISVVIVTHKNYEEVGKAWLKSSGKNPDLGNGIRVVAFANWADKPINGILSCTIHIVDPKINYRPQYIGHELVHCMHGNFHPSQGG